MRRTLWQFVAQFQASRFLGAGTYNLLLLSTATAAVGRDGLSHTSLSFVVSRSLHTEREWNRFPCIKFHISIRWLSVHIKFCTIHPIVTKK
ncbi:hypothetical protein CPB84DRAFT_1829290, partial [Gymnopilus junonius]